MPIILIAYQDGMLEKGVLQISNDEKNWEDAETFGFGNLINDPTSRTHYFKKRISAKYIQVKAKAIAGNKSTGYCGVRFFRKIKF